MLTLCTVSCSAKSEKEKAGKSPLQQSEIIMRKAIGDSLSNIILKSRHVEISTDSCPAKKLNAEERTIIRYLVSDTCNYASDMTVFGKFVPYLCIKFKHYKKSIYVQYDFSLHKWIMKGSDGKLLCMYDLKSNDILRFATLALPEDKYLYEFQNQQ